MSNSKSGVSSEVKLNYADYYEDGDSEWRRLGAIDKADNIVSLCGDLPHDSIIDIGVGEGSILQRLSDLNFGAGLYGLEISPSGVETTKNKKIENLIDCQLFNGYDIPYDEKKFDLAVVSHVIEHVEFPRRLIYEAARVARYLFIEVPLEHTVRLRHDYTANKVGHINFYSPKTIRRLLQTCNLRVLRQDITNPSRATCEYAIGKKGVAQHFVRSAMLKALPRIAPAIFCYHAAMVCEKS
jgi:ubiquinone/menaquinone biosynthesis C-methylase UbiE